MRPQPDIAPLDSSRINGPHWPRARRHDGQADRNADERILNAGAGPLRPSNAAATDGSHVPALSNPTVMLVMADEPRREHLGQALTDRGVEVVTAADAAMTDSVATSGMVDVVVVDHVTPLGNGLSVCLRLSVLRAPPVILLAPAPDEADRIVALEVGADDCLPTSVTTRELIARIRTLARRAVIQRETEARHRGSRFSFAGFSLCLETRVLRRPDGEQIFLRATEAALLLALVRHPREPLSRERLRALIGAQDAEDKRVVDQRMYRLRRALRDHGFDPDLIQTIPGRGYLLKADVRVI